MIRFSKRYIFLFFSLTFSFNSLYAEIEEGVYLADQGGREAFLAALGEVSSGEEIIVGSYKLQQGLMPSAEILQRLRNLNAAGVRCRVLLESRLSKEEQRNDPALPMHASLNAYRETGVHVIPNLANYKNVHLKILVTNNLAMISNTNYDNHPDKTIIRDFSLFTKNPTIIGEMKQILQDVEAGTPIYPQEYKISDIHADETRLTWGPMQHRDHLTQMIGSAQASIIIYQQDLQDMMIVQSLLEKLAKGVEVRILMSQYPFGKKHGNKNLLNLMKLVEAGAKVRLVGERAPQNMQLPLHIHAKILIVDGKMMYLGSANFYPDVLNPNKDNLNLGAITTETRYIEPVLSTFEGDWQAHEGFDLIAEESQKAA